MTHVHSRDRYFYTVQCLAVNGLIRGLNLNSGNYLFTTDTK